MKIILIRHGITVTNKKKIYSLDDSPLADEAYPALDALKKKLESYEFEKAYTSPFKRAVQTAEYLGLKHICADTRLQEYNFGVFKGLTFAEAEAEYPFEAKKWIEQNETFSPPQGETSLEHFTRVSQFLNEITSQDKNCIAVTHYGTITMALAWALDNFSFRNKFSPKNASITVLSVYSGKKTIEAVNA